MLPLPNIRGFLRLWNVLAVHSIYINCGYSTIFIERS